jgi:DNA (cytosine-5)-methyltransferase 1
MAKNKNVMPAILSLFSGCGGLDWGFHEAGYKTVWVNDINEWAVKTFEKNFGKNIITQKNNVKGLITANKDKAIKEILRGIQCRRGRLHGKNPTL